MKIILGGGWPTGCLLVSDILNENDFGVECISIFLAEKSPIYFENKIYMLAPHFQKIECAQQLVK
jgi:hypothetical protein